MTLLPEPVTPPHGWACHTLALAIWVRPITEHNVHEFGGAWMAVRSYATKDEALARAAETEVLRRVVQSSGHAYPWLVESAVVRRSLDTHDSFIPVPRDAVVVQVPYTQSRFIVSRAQFEEGTHHESA